MGSQSHHRQPPGQGPAGQGDKGHRHSPLGKALCGAHDSISKDRIIEYLKTAILLPLSHIFFKLNIFVSHRPFV